MSLFTDASFSEYFYGLQRVSVGADTNNNGQSITIHERNLSMIYLVLLPYLKIKIEQRLAVYRLELADNILTDVSF